MEVTKARRFRFRTMSEEEKIVFTKDAFDSGACATFVKDAGRVAVDVRAAFSIDPKTVRKRLASHSFVEFADVSVGACLVQTKDERGADKEPCIFLLTNAQMRNAALREIGRQVSKELHCAVFLYANGLTKMNPLTDATDKRFEAFSETLVALARRLFEEEK